MHKSALLLSQIGNYHSLPRLLKTSALVLILLAPLLAVSGCHYVEGAASNTAGQLNKREKRNDQVSDILDGLPKKKP